MRAINITLTGQCNTIFIQSPFAVIWAIIWVNLCNTVGSCALLPVHYNVFFTLLSPLQRPKYAERCWCKAKLKTNLRNIQEYPAPSQPSLWLWILYLLFHNQYLCSPSSTVSLHYCSQPGTKPGGFDSSRQDQSSEDTDLNISICVGSHNAH